MMSGRNRKANVTGLSVDGMNWHWIVACRGISASNVILYKERKKDGVGSSGGHQRAYEEERMFVEEMKEV